MAPNAGPTETRKPFTGYLWGGLAVLTCLSCSCPWPSRPN
ncbi:hypothetical protein [Acidithiobacillus ferrooxidans]